MNNDKTTKELEEIPSEGDVQRTKPVRVLLCRRNKCVYQDNGDGTASCTICPKGVILAGYQRIFEGKVYDLRTGIGE